jgi:hypothetical protein
VFVLGGCDAQLKACGVDTERDVLGGARAGLLASSAPPLAAGTLGQVYLFPLPSWLLAGAGRVVAALAEALIVVAGIYGIVCIVVPLRHHWSAAALLPAVLLIVTGIG